MIRRPRTTTSPGRPQIACAVFVVVFLVMLDLSVVEAALPVISRELNTGIDGLQWVVNCYALAVASLLLVGGALSRRLGLRRALLTSVALFAGGSGMCAASASLEILLIGRGVQGVGAALAIPAGLAMVSRLFPDQKERNRALGLWSALNGVAIAAGPILGGLVVERANWRVLFAINLPLLLAAFAALGRLLPRENGEPRHIDYASVALSIVAVGGLALGVTEGVPEGYTSPLVAASLVLSASSAVCLFARERRRGDQALIPMGLFRQRVFAASATTALVIGLVPVTCFLLIVLYFQEVQGQSPSRAGLAFVPVAVGMSLAAWAAGGRLVARLGAVELQALGLLLALPGVAAFALVPGDASAVLLSAALLCFGAGLGLALTGANVGALHDVPENLTGPAAATVNVALEAGGVIGVAVFGALLNATYARSLNRLVDGSQATTAALMSSPRSGGSGISPALRDLAIDKYAGALRLTTGAGALTVAAALVTLTAVATAVHRRPVLLDASRGAVDRRASK